MESEQLIDSLKHPSICGMRFVGRGGRRSGSDGLDVFKLYHWQSQLLPAMNCKLGVTNLLCVLHTAHLGSKSRKRRSGIQTELAFVVHRCHQ